jgi:L-lactate permease
MTTFSGGLKWFAMVVGGGLVIGVILCKIEDWHANRKWRLEREKEKAAWKAKQAKINEEHYLRRVQAFKAQLGKNSGSTGDVGLS